MDRVQDAQKDILRQDWGYWESKDESDNLDEEIRKKFAKGYPKENILLGYQLPISSSVFEEHKIFVHRKRNLSQFNPSHWFKRFRNPSC